MNLFIDYLKYTEKVESEVRLHAEEIGMQFFDGNRPTVIGDYDTGLADRHNGGLMSLKLKTDAGMLMYKPHSLKCDLTARHLFEEYFDDIVKVPKALDYGDYGFAEYITNRPAETAEEAARYFYNLGGVAAIAHAIGMSDLVMENFLAEGSIPVFVDPEFFVSPARPSEIWNRNLEGSFERQVRDVFEDTALFGVLEKSKPIGLLNNYDTVNQGLPVIDGIRQKPYDYPGEISRGFADVYQRCMENREGILRIIHELEGTPIRVFVRSTSYYSKMTLIAKDPRVKGSREISERILGRMEEFYKEAGITGYEMLLKTEQECILHEDIPFFLSEPDSRGVFFKNQCLHENYFAKSIFENAKTRLDSLSEADKLFSLNLLEKNLNYPAYEIEQERVEADPKAGMIDPQTAAADAGKLFERIFGELITAPDGTRGFLSIRYASAGIEPCNASIGFGITGVAVFAAAIQRVLPEYAEESEVLIGAACDCIEAYLQGIERGNARMKHLTEVGFFSGFGGIYEALLIIKQLAPDDRINQMYERMVRLPGMFRLERITEPGVYNGLSGIILALCDSRNDCYDPETIIRAADLLNDLIASEDYRHLSGLGNGISGIGTALLAAYKATGIQRYLEKAGKLFVKEHRLYREELSTWPDLRNQAGKNGYMHGICSGAPGIGIAMNIAGKFGIDTAVIDRERAVNAMKNLPMLYEDRLCCGNASIAESLITIGDYDEAAKLLGKMHNRYRKTGNMILYPSKNRNAFIPGLLFGYAGIGYEFLRFAFPEILPGIFDFGM